MRFVVDTNVFISAALKADSSPRRALRWIERYGRILKSRDTERELYGTLAKPKLAMLLSDRVFLDGLNTMMRTAELVEVNERIQICRDPDDDKFLELAVNGGADMIVSGDIDLLALDAFRTIPIVDPATFIRGVIGQSGESE